jgi:hypothetical protein
MNVAFHTLAGLAISQTAASRLKPAAAAGPPRRRLGRRDAGIAAAVFALGVASHGVLDGLKHYYPLSSAGDALTSAALFCGWLALVPRRLWPLFFIGFAGAIFPDLFDHVPRDLNRHLGLTLPVLPKVFPWHWPEGSGSLSGAHPPAFGVVSLANHVIVVSFCAVALWLTRDVLRLPRGPQ